MGKRGEGEGLFLLHPVRPLLLRRRRRQSIQEKKEEGEGRGRRRRRCRRRWERGVKKRLWTGATF